MLNYLSHVVGSWRSIVHGTSTDFDHQAVDSATVQYLESLAPRASHVDEEHIRTLMHDRSIFARIVSQSDQDIILRNLLSFEGMIPSLYTFFEGLKYLEPCAKILRSLLPPRSKRSIFQSFSASYFRPTQLRIEYAHNDTRSHPSDTYDQDRALGYHQLWLRALRDFPSMTDVAPRKETDQEKPLVSEPNPILWQNFASLAMSQGFRTAAAEELSARDGIHQLAEQVLKRANFEPTRLAVATRGIVDILKSLTASATPSDAVPAFSGEECVPKERRCGRPFADDHHYDREFLFLPYIHQSIQCQGSEITTFYCKWEMLRTFLGIHNVSIVATLSFPDVLLIIVIRVNLSSSAHRLPMALKRTETP